MHATTGIQLAYTMVLVTLFAALYKQRASIVRILLAPFAAVAVTLIASVALALLSLPWAPLAGVPLGVKIVFNSALLLVMGYTAGRCLARYRAAPLDSLYQRGAVLVGTALGEAAAAASPPARVGGLTLAGVPVPVQDETQHFKLIGTPGNGKSTAIGELLGAALARGDRAVITDPDGGYLERFYDAARGDVILNPFHVQSLKWDLFAEIDAEADIEPLSRSLIPEGKDEERAWNNYARTFFSELIRYCRGQATPSDHALLHLVTATSQADLREILAGGPAGHILKAGNERMFASVRSVAASALRVLALTSAQAGVPFSVRRWVREGTGVLFLPYGPGEIAALRTSISAWTRLAIFEAMDGPEDDRRLWFIVDELDALGAIDGLKDTLARLRKFGGRCVLGLQSIAQVSSTYGHGAAQTIAENTGNTLILRCSASEQGGTARYASRLIGEHHILRRIISRRVRAFVPRVSWVQPISEQPYTETGVLSSQIERLPDLEGFLKLASHPDWRHVRLAPSEPAIQRPRATPMGQPASAAPAGELPAPEPLDKESRGPSEPPVQVIQAKGEGAAKRARRKGPAVATAVATMVDSAPAPATGVLPQAAHGPAAVPSGADVPGDAAVQLTIAAKAAQDDVPPEPRT